MKSPASTQEKLKAKVRQFIADTDTSQAELARRSGISAVLVSLWLKGERELSRVSVQRIYRAIDPLRGDLDAVALQICLKLRRKYLTRSEIAIIGGRISEMVNSTTGEDVNDSKRYSAPTNTTQ